MLTVEQSSPDIVLVGNPVIWKIKTDSIAGNFYRIHLQVLERDFKQDNELIFVGEDSVEPDMDGISTFDISMWLQKLLRNNSFTFDYDGLFFHMKQIKPYRLNYFYTYHNDQGRYKSPETMVSGQHEFHAVNGRLTDLQHKLYLRSGKTFLDDLNEKRFFLTLQPRTKEISINQLERLYFLYTNFSCESSRLTGKILFADGTETLFNTNKITTEARELYSVKTGYYELGIDGYDSIANPIVQYEIWCEAYGSEYAPDVLWESEKFTYILDRKHYEHERYFVFRNRLGGYDVVRTKGIKEINNAYENVNGQSNNGIFKLHSSVEETHKANTGIISATYNEYLQEIFESTEVYEIENDMLYNVVLQNKKSQAYKDNQFLFNQIFEYVRDINLDNPTTGSGSGNIIIDGQAEFACANAKAMVVGDEVIVEIDVTNISQYDGETYMTFDFGEEMENGEAYELQDVTYFYYSDQQPSVDNKYTKVSLIEGENRFIISDLQERAIFVHYYIENTDGDIKRYQAGKLIVHHDDANVHVTPNQVDDENDDTLFNNVEISANLLENQIELQVDVLSTIGETALFYHII